MNNKSNDIYTLIHLISEIKEREINFYVDKVNSLKFLMQTNPNDKMCFQKYRLARVRFEKLILTSKG